MSNLFNRILGNLATRMMLIIYLAIIVITGFFIVFSYYNALALQEQRQYDKLQAIASSIAISVDGDKHSALFDRYSGINEAEIKNDPDYIQISNLMHEIVDANHLSPTYTLVYDKVTQNFKYGVRSDDYVDFKNDYKMAPSVLLENMQTGGIIPLYESENGMWISAFYPIKNDGGEVVALIEADIEFSEFNALVNARYQKELLIALSVIIAIALLLIPYARKVLNADEKQKVLNQNQKMMIESKNRDIMGSIRYALKIQSSMLPSESCFSDNGLEGFIYHRAKDVVAGDFYWIEKKEDCLYFAVADCTGHGVPGAILSIICSNALNRAAVTMNLSNTNEILDAVRDMIIERLGKGEDLMKDGMDICLCRLNLKTLELQYTGANNPLYILKKGASVIETLKPCKQPVGMHVRQDPFNKKEQQLAKGDTLYLFTDGYADQFGGPNGKKFKYKAFKNTLIEHSNLPAIAQKTALNKSLNDWQKGFEQVDDICVMGVKI